MWTSCTPTPSQTVPGEFEWFALIVREADDTTVRDESRFAESVWQKLEGASTVTIQFIPDPLGSADAGRVIYRQFRNGTTFVSDTWSKVKLFPENTTVEWKDDILETGYAAEVKAKAEQTETTRKRKAKLRELRAAGRK